MTMSMSGDREAPSQVKSSSRSKPYLPQLFIFGELALIRRPHTRGSKDAVDSN